MAPHRLDLDLLAGLLAVAKLAPDSAAPSWALGDGFSSLTRTDQELSIVCPQARLPADVAAERGFRCFRVRGPLAFTETGVVASLAAPLAESEIALFIVSTFDTDYLLVRDADVTQARQALVAAGHTVHEQGVA